MDRGKHNTAIAVACLLLAGATLAACWPAFRFDFVNLDDFDYVRENRHVQAGLTAEGVAWAQPAPAPGVE